MTAVVYSWQLLVVGTGLAQTRAQTLHPSCAIAGRLDFALHGCFCVHVLDVLSMPTIIFLAQLMSLSAPTLYNPTVSDTVETLLCYDLSTARGFMARLGTWFKDIALLSSEKKSQ